MPLEGKELRISEENRKIWYGYQEHEVDLPHLDLKNREFVVKGKVIKLDPTVKNCKIHVKEEISRPIVMASLGCHLKDAAMPHPDPSDPNTALVGALYRFGRDIPARNFPAKEFSDFVRDFVVKNFIPLGPETDISVETWLSKTPYTLARKNELLKKSQDMQGDTYNLKTKDLKVKSFVKDETYPEYKHARAINSRTDEFKVAVGPFFQAISDAVFALIYFIKKIPIAERPQNIIDAIQRDGHVIFTTDFTSFEAHFRKEIMEACEMILYEHMVKHHPDGKRFLALIKNAFYELDNVIESKNFNMSVNGKRMSGEMNTSLGNGFSNLMFLLFLCFKSGATDVEARIEGDDGITSLKGTPPTVQQFEDFGLSIKLLQFNQLEHASFCGLVFDVDDRDNITDPMCVLANFGITTSRYAKSRKNVHMHLLRAKALSMAYEYRSCPILNSLAKKIVHLTRDYDVLSWLQKQGTHAFCLYELEIIYNSLDYFKKNGLGDPPKLKTRLLMETLYGLSVSDQLALEAYFDSWTTIQVIDHPLLEIYIPRVWSVYDETYSQNTAVKSMKQSDAVWPSMKRPVFNSTTRRLPPAGGSGQPT